MYELFENKRARAFLKSVECSRRGARMPVEEDANPSLKKGITTRFSDLAILFKF